MSPPHSWESDTGLAGTWHTSVEREKPRKYLTSARDLPQLLAVSYWPAAGWAPPPPRPNLRAHDDRGSSAIPTEVRQPGARDDAGWVRTCVGSPRVAGDSYEGTVSCLGTKQGVIKAASRAALQAALQATVSSASHLAAAGIDLEVVGVKAVRAFDGWVVVTRVHGSAGSETYQLLGAAPCESEDDLPGAAVRAALNASNRVLGQRVAR